MKLGNVMINMGVLCSASEKGKIIVNECLKRGLTINTLKLEKLLILMHIKMLTEYRKPFFKEEVINFHHGLGIKEVDEDFRGVLRPNFNEQIIEYICLLDAEEKVMNEVIRDYGKYDVFDLNEVWQLKKLQRLFPDENGKGMPYQLIMAAFYDKFYDKETTNKRKK